jgi:hypothetical protein
MGKQKKPDAAAAPAAETVTAEAQQQKGTDMATTDNEGAATALVPVQAAAIEPVSAVSANKALADRLPARYREDVLFMVRPTPEQLIGIVERLSPDNQARVVELVRKTRPKKQGAHTSKEGFSPTQLRVFQGTGNDPAKPAKLPPGNFYTVDSRDMGDTIDGVILGFYEGRTMWPPRDSGSSDSKGPLCYSLDRKMGSRYGDCDSCPNANKKYNEGGCGREVTIWFVDRELTGIYELKFSKSSMGGGDALTRILSKADNLWDRYFTIKNDERTEGDRRWFVTKATPVVDAKNPAAQNTPKEIHPLYEALSRLLDSDVYFPALASVYDSAKGSAHSAAAVVASADEAALLGNDAGTPDYSGDNPNL